ncbi:MAG: DUF3593 domain-containing protein [Chlorobiaceae bacterium]|nr:DUF3593 domain-containing protein [Chlorobiaceae bacterium]
MLLSFPNWIIHLFSALEWGVAILMLYRYGKLINRPDVGRFGLLMIPHWIGSWFVLSYHLSGDRVPQLLDMSELVNLVGSICLLYATIRILKRTGPETAFAGAVLGGIAVSGHPQSYMGNNVFDAILQVSSVVYMVFLVLLLKVRRRDPEVFSGLTVAGFWFVLVFISVTVFCMYIATEVRGYPTLSHDDLLHGTAESLLSISNLMIVLGIHRQTKKRLEIMSGTV